MTTRSRLEAELATRRYTRRHAREIVTAVLGNNAGTVVATTDTRWCWIRLHGDANQVVRAWNAGFVPPVNNLPVDAEIVKGNGITDYQIVGVSINKGVAADAYADATGMHALQHQRRDFNTGGYDPLDIYARAIVQLRARAQATPDMTLYVEPGWYPVAGIATYFAGGNSPAFTAPGGGARCDLLYLDSTGTLQIATGVVAALGMPPRPAQPAATDLPLAYVYLTAATTSITEYIIEDARVVFGGGSGGTSGSDIDSAPADSPLDADEFGFFDVVDAILKKITWANIKAALKTYFDTLYAAIAAITKQLLGHSPYSASIVSDASTVSTANMAGQQSTIASIVRSGTVWQCFVFYNSADNLAIAVRKVPGEWTIYATAHAFPGGGDAHNVAAVGLDPNGYIHVAWGMHDSALQYFKSTLPIESFAGVITGNLAMLGTNEASVTYPTFANDPQGNLYFVFRAGSSLNGDLYFYKYNHATTTWGAATGTAAQGRLINGTSSPKGVYWIGPYFDPTFGSGGKMHLFFVWATAPHTYSNYCYVSWDGTNFKQSSGAAQTVPITPANAEVFDTFSTTMNPGLLIMSAGTDAGGHPHVAYSRDDGTSTEYLYHWWHDGSSWVSKKFTTLTPDPVVYMGVIMGIDRESNTVWLVVEDNGTGDDYLRMIFSAPGDFTTWYTVVLWSESIDPSAGNNFFPSFDQAEWERNHRFHIPLTYWPGTGNHPAPITLLSFIPSGWGLWDASNYPQLHANDTDTAVSAIHHTLGTGADQAAAGNDTRLSDARTPLIDTLVLKASPIDSDEIDIADSAAGFAVKKTTLLDIWSNWLKIKTDALYGASAHVHGLARWTADGGTAFDLPDFAEYVDTVSDNGVDVDPLLYTLASGGAQVVFDSGPTAGHILLANYAIGVI